jgi:hypothetical protein
LVYINGEPITNNNSCVEILQNHGDRGDVLKLSSIPLKQGDAIFCSGQSGYGKSHIAMAIYKDGKYIWSTDRNCKVINADNLDFPAPLELMLDGKDMQQAETAKSPYLERISEFEDALPGGDFPGDIIWCPEAETIYMFGIFNIKKN